MRHNAGLLVQRLARCLRLLARARPSHIRSRARSRARARQQRAARVDEPRDGKQSCGLTSHRALVRQSAACANEPRDEAKVVAEA